MEHPGRPGEVDAGEIAIRQNGIGQRRAVTGDEAVSYTHLDVYKRQGLQLHAWKVSEPYGLAEADAARRRLLALPELQRQLEGLSARLARSRAQLERVATRQGLAVPVSYTHLQGPQDDDLVPGEPGLQDQRVAAVGFTLPVPHRGEGILKGLATPFPLRPLAPQPFAPGPEPEVVDVYVDAVGAVQLIGPLVGHLEPEVAEQGQDTGQREVGSRVELEAALVAGAAGLVIEVELCLLYTSRCV